MNIEIKNFTVVEIKDLKATLRDDIETLISDFNKNTLCKVTEVNVFYKPLSSSIPSTDLIYVTIKTEI